jgi:DNA-binding SARP family transcriptional activator
MDREPVARLAIRLLGSFAVTVRDVPIRGIGSPRRTGARLVKLLALTPAHRLHRDQVVEKLWPELDAPSAANTFHRAVYAARHVLEPDLAPRAPSAYLHLQGEILLLGNLARPVDVSIDVDAFEDAAARARRSRDPSDYAVAIALYTGDLLPEERYADWVSGRREQLRQRFGEALREAAQTCEARGDLPAAIDALSRLVARSRPTGTHTWR